MYLLSATYRFCRIHFCCIVNYCTIMTFYRDDYALQDCTNIFIMIQNELNLKQS